MGATTMATAAAPPQAAHAATAMVAARAATAACGAVQRCRGLLAASLLAMLLGACTATPGIPETTWFRLPERADLQSLPAPVFERPLLVESYLADGVHSDQALLYAMDAEGTQLRAYHYQLWADPPTRMLQRRLMATLRDAGVAPIVVDRLSTRSDSVRVGGRIERFERLPRGDGWRVAVALVLRAEASDATTPLLVKRYEEQLDADGPGIADSVQAMGVAVDRIHAAFVADLAAAAGGLPR